VAGADLQQAGLMKECALARAAHNGHYQTCKFLVAGTWLAPACLFIVYQCPRSHTSLNGHYQTVRFFVVGSWHLHIRGGCVPD